MGNQSLQISANGYTSKNASTSVIGTDPMIYNISLVKIIFTTVSGIVSDSASGVALGGVIVRLGGGSGGTNRYDTTGADGLYSFDNVATGNQSLRASLTGYTTKPSTVSVTGAAPITLNIMLVKTILPTVSGKVTDTLSGAALAGAIVRIGAGMSFLYDTTGTDGTYSISKVSNGTHSITVTLKGYATKVINSAITGTDPVTVNVQLKAPVSVLTEISKNAFPAFSISKRILKLQNMSGPGLFKLYNLDGKLICKLPFTRSTETLLLHQSAFSNSAAIIANVITDGKTFTQRLNLLE
jgi:hypothetical protein